MTCPRLFVIGDSISMQYGPYLEQYLTGQFEDKRNGRRILLEYGGVIVMGLLLVGTAVP